MTKYLDRLPVVFDCMIFLQGLIKDKGTAVDCLDLFEQGKLELFISTELLDEVKDVLTRPKLQAKYALLTEKRANNLIEQLQTRATFVKSVPKKFSYSRDPKDEPYINLAVAAGANYIVSRDSDLLDLMTGYTDECKEFRQRFRPLKVIEPIELLRLVRDAESQEK